MRQNNLTVRRWAACMLLSAVCVLASVGDRSEKYALCVQSCITDTCKDHRPVVKSDDTIVQPDELPWYLILTGWSCESNCGYHCTHRITNEARKRVHDIRSKATMQAQNMQQTVAAMNERWREQLAWEKAGDDLKDVCGPEEFVGPNGTCLPLMHEAPPPLISDATMRSSVEADVQLRLAQLPLIDKETVQFFGKWPHIRMFGMQEPMSVIFSLLNLIVQIHASRSLFLKGIPPNFPLRGVYRTHTRIAMMAWIASCVFHARDVWWTERWDYFSAAMLLLSGFFLTVCRIFQIQPNTPLFKRFRWTLVGAWVLHVLYLLSHVRLDYSYNMLACTLLGVVHNLLWLAYAQAPNLLSRLANKSLRLAKWSSGHRDDNDSTESSAVTRPLSTGALSGRLRQRLELLTLAMFLAPALELFDFPPLLRLVDAHALWHLATVPLTIYFYRWLADDANESVSMRGWRSNHHDVELSDIHSFEVPVLSRAFSSATETSWSTPLRDSLPNAMNELRDRLPAVPLSVPPAMDPVVRQAQGNLQYLQQQFQQGIHTLRDLLIAS